MRLTEQEVRAIKDAALEAFGETAVVRLFGSRVHDDLRGGDVDLHFEIDGPTPDYRLRGQLWAALDLAVDGRKVDTIFSIRGSTPRGFERIAYRDGIVL